MAEPAILLDEVGVVFREGTALHGVCLSMQPGEFVGVIGPNGAGKTTLLRVLNGLLPPTHGKALVLGRVPHRATGYRLRRRVGYVAQVERLDPRLPITVRDSVMTGMYGRMGWFGRPTRADWDRVDEAMAWVGVSALADRPLGRLSGGEYQKVAIARVLVQQPELFLFDEPTASIDPEAQREIIGLIQAIHRGRGATALYVTHELSTLPQACRRLILMKRGRVWRDGDRAAMLEEHLLRDLYNGERPRNGGPLESTAPSAPAAPREALR